MRKCKPVKVGNLTLDGEKIYVQSMLNIPAENIDQSVRQAIELENAGCEIVRAAIPNMDAVKLIPATKHFISIINPFSEPFFRVLKMLPSNLGFMSSNSAHTVFSVFLSVIRSR